MYNYIGINQNGVAVYDLTRPSTVEKLIENGADFSVLPEVCPYMASFGIVEYVTGTGFSNEYPLKYWYNGGWVDMPEDFWAVFNPTANDLENSFPVAAQSLDGLRKILQPKTPNYVYEGTGACGGFASITAQRLTADELNILFDSPFFNQNVDEETDTNRFILSDRRFAQKMVQRTKAEILKTDATLQQKQAAISLLSEILNQLTFGFISTSYMLLLFIVPQGAFTAEIQANILNDFSGYLKKFPR